MSSIGKRMRLRRLIEPGINKTVFFAASHGTTSPLVLKGTEDLISKVAQAHRGGATGCFLSGFLLWPAFPLLFICRGNKVKKNEIKKK